MARYQIVKMEPGADRWQFVAHGARYEREEAEEFRSRLHARGCETKLLTIPTRKAAK